MNYQPPRASEIVNRITVEPVREHLEQVLWARLEELIGSEDKSKHQKP